MSTKEIIQLIVALTALASAIFAGLKSLQNSEAQQKVKEFLKDDRGAGYVEKALGE